MLLIQDKNKLTRVYAPKVIPTSDMFIEMRLTGESDNNNYTLNLIDTEYSGDYFEFDINANELPEQEYKYELYNFEDKYLGCGLLRVGNVTKYVEKTNKNIEKYTDLL